MRWKAPSLIVLSCCLATTLVVRAQAGRTGLSVIVAPTESAVEELLHRIRTGGSFEALATSYSSDPTASRAGYMGVVDEATLRPEFRSALNGLKPGNVSTVVRVGDNFMLLKRTTDPEDRWRVQQDSGVAALQQGRYAEATEKFLIAVQQAEAFGRDDVRLAESLNGLAQILRYQQKFADAEPRARQSLAILERSLGIEHHGLLPSLTNIASIARARGDPAGAEQAYRRILAIRWGAPGEDRVSADDVLENFAEVLSFAPTRDPRLERALDTFWRSLTDTHLNKDVFPGMRDRLLTAQLVPEAESLMLRAVRLHPESREVRYRLGELYVTWGKYERAIEVFQDAARLDAGANSDMDRIQRSRIYERIGEMNFFLVRFDEAFPALTKSLEVNPSNTGSRLLLGALYIRRNRFDEAEVEYGRVIAADPRNAAAHDGLAHVYLSLGRYHDSVIAADKALALDPELQTSRYYKAMALIREGRQEGKAALDDYQRREEELRAAQAQRNDIAEVQRTTSSLLAEKRPDKAIEVLREGIERHPLSAALHLKLGLAQSQAGLSKDAAETFETMVRLKLDDFLVHRQLAVEHANLGNKERSQQERVVYLQRYDAALQSNLKP